MYVGGGAAAVFGDVAHDARRRERWWWRRRRRHQDLALRRGLVEDRAWAARPHWRRRWWRTRGNDWEA
eukprot:scaffold128495_cov75-Phaeocystis_antarctica.AAC.2